LTELEIYAKRTEREEKGIKGVLLSEAQQKVLEEKKR